MYAVTIRNIDRICPSGLRPFAEPGGIPAGREMSEFNRSRLVRGFGIWLVGAICCMALASSAAEGAAAPESKPDLFQAGLKAYENGSYQKAIRLFQESIEKNPTESNSHYFLGITHQRLKKHQNAIQAFRKALSLNPERHDIQLPLGISLYRIKQYEEARLAFSKVLEGNPKSLDAHFFIGLIYLGEKKYRFAASHLEQAAKDKSLAPAAKLNLGTAYYHLKEFEKAKRQFQEVRQLDREGRFAESAKQLQELAESGSSLGRPWKLKAEGGIEFSDNVTQVESEQVTNVGDSAAIFSLEGQYKLFEKSGYGATAGYDFFQSVYDDITTQNFQSHTGGISFARAIKNWELGVDYRFNYNFLDKKDFLQIQTISPKISLLSKSWLFSQLSYSFQEKIFFRDSERDATAHLIGFNQFFFFAQSKGFLLIGGQFEAENADAQRFDFHGYSGNASVRFPLSLALSTLAGTEPTKNLPWNPVLLVGVSYRLKDFTSETPDIARERKDETWSIRAGLETKLFLGFYGIVQYRNTSNDSNLGTVKYNENILSLSIRHKF